MRPLMKNPCIICGKHEGEYACEDGCVCGECMPKEFLPNARIVSRKRIIRFWRTHSGSGLSAGTRKIESHFAEIPSHSSAITPGCGFALIDALDTLKGKVTILMIAHRTTSIRHCDRLIEI